MKNKQSIPDIKIENLTINEWDSKAIKLGKVRTWLDTREQEHKQSSIYKLYLDDEEMPIYIGKATDNGIFKRINDYIKKNADSRKADAGILINYFQDRIRIEAIIIGDKDYHKAYAVAIEPFLIMKYKPRWNKEYNKEYCYFTEKELEIIKAKRAKYKEEKEPKKK